LVKSSSYAIVLSEGTLDRSAEPAQDGESVEYTHIALPQSGLQKQMQYQCASATRNS
jgi:hypothetical protein